MRVSEAIETRRAIKQFDPNHRLSETEQDRLIELAMHSPTAFKEGLHASDAALRALSRADARRSSAAEG
ncbi:MAG: hypothetical protein ACOCPR_04585, partial [Guyparkeria sp.]